MSINRLALAYFNVDAHILCDTAHDGLPPLKAALQLIATNPPVDPDPGVDDLPTG